MHSVADPRPLFFLLPSFSFMTSGSSAVDDDDDGGSGVENRSIDVLVDDDDDGGTQLIAYSVFEQVCLRSANFLCVFYSV